MHQDTNRVFRSWIDDRDPDVVVQRIVEGIGTDRASLTFMFVDPDYDLERLGAAINRSMHGPVLACTTAGELIGETGYATHGISVAALDSDRVKAQVHTIDNLTDFGVVEAQQLKDSLSLEDGSLGERKDMFGILLVDGMSNREERVSALIHGGCNGLRVVGGSAGDAGRFVATHVYDGKRFRTNAAVFGLVTTSLPNTLFRFQHFEPDSRRMVVTRADPSNRILIELDGEPAAKAYCDHLKASSLDQSIVAAHPLLLQCGSEYYARSIRTWDDERLMLYCSIEEGMVVRLGHGCNLVGTLRAQLDSLNHTFGRTPLLAVSFDCILRRLEVMQNNQGVEFRDVVSSYPMVGFSTYGEQFNGLHINQTMTGFAIAA